DIVNEPIERTHGVPGLLPSKASMKVVGPSIRPRHCYRCRPSFESCRRSEIGISVRALCVTTKADLVTNNPTEAINSVRHLTDTWRTIVLDRGPADVSDLPSIAIRWADSKFPFWNCITFTDQGVDARSLDHLLAQAVAYMRQKTQRGLIWL